MRVRVRSGATGAAALLLSSVHGMVQAKVIRVVLELLGGAIAAFCEPQTPPVSLSTTGPGVIHQLRQHRSCRSCAGARHAVTARLSSGSPKAAHARDSTHGRDSVASRAHSALHTCVSFKRCRPNCLLARPCAVSTTRSARLLTRRWHAGQRFLNLMHSFGSATSTCASRSRTVCRLACRCSRKLFDYASSWAHPVPLRPHHCAYVGRLLSSWLGVVRP